MNPAPERVVIYGASGRAGRMIARAFARNGYALLLAGRSANRLKSVARELGCSAVPASLDDPVRLRQLLTSARVVINCAGPFHETARPLAEAAVASGVHYVDISGERRSVRALLELSLNARAANVAVVPAAGAKGALGLWTSALAAESGWFASHPRERLRITYAHSGSAYWRPTPGALLSTAAEGAEWEAHRPLDHGPPPISVTFPSPFRSGLAVYVTGTEDILVPLTLGNGLAVDSYLSVDPGTDANVAWGAFHGAAFGAITRAAAPLLWRAMIDMGAEKLSSLLPAPEPGALVVVVEPAGPPAEHRRIAVSAADGYAATVSTVRAVVDRLLAAGRAGLLTVSQIVPAGEALKALAVAGAVRVLKDDRSLRSTRAPESR